MNVFQRTVIKDVIIIFN